MGSVGRYPLFLAAFCLLAEAQQGCTAQPDNTYEPVSEACLSCLTEEKSEGCKAQFDACEGVSSCDDYVVCQLMGRCFEREPNSGCEVALGCFEPSDKVSEGDAGASQSPRELAQAVEDCARSTCADTCGFVD